MLEQFTWQEFWLAMLLLTLLWYSGVILTCYRKELNLFLKGPDHPGAGEPLTHRWSEPVAENKETHLENDGVLGLSRPDEGTSTVSMGQISFGQDEDAKSDQLGLIPDVLQEMKEIFSILEKEDGDKRDFFNMIEMVRAKYGQIGSNPRIVQVNQFIAEHAPFHLSKEELENLWD